MREPLLVLDENLRVKTANAAFYATFLTTAKDTEGTRMYELGNGQWDTPQLRKALEKILPLQSTIQDLEITFNYPGIGKKVMIPHSELVRFASANHYGRMASAS